MSETILVITGDVAGSMKSGLADSRDLLLSAFGQVAESFPETRLGGAFQIIRGDGFQGAFGSVARGLRCALFFHAFFRSVRGKAGSPSGVRIGLGLGSGSIETGGVLASTGEAFVLSGKALDSMKDSRDAVMRIRSPWDAVNRILDMEFRLLEAVLDGWTMGQANVMAQALRNTGNAMSQSMIARDLGVDQSQVSRQLRKARFGTLLALCDHVQFLADDASGPGKGEPA